MEKNKIFASKEYIKILYDSQKRPFSSYPDLLAKHITEKYFFEKGKLVDIGCGRGDMLKAFAGIGFQAGGLDLSPASVELCYPHEVKRADLEVERFPYEDCSVDFVFSKSVIEHLSNPLHAMSESNRILRDGGRAVFMTPSWKHNSWGPFYLDHTHVTPFTKFSLKNAMILAGFKDVEVHYFYQLPFVWRMDALKAIPKLISMFPLSYWPMEEVNLHPNVNKLIRFSNEVMLLAICKT